MAGSKSDRQLETWSQVASNATLPPYPPKATTGSSFAIATLATVIGLILVVLAMGPSLLGTASAPVASGSDATPAPSAIAVAPAGSGAAAATSPSAAATPSVAAATPIASASRDGECSADQFVLGSVATGPGGSTFGTESVYVHVPLRNLGSDCTLRVPSTIRVGSSSGATLQVAIENAMTTATYRVKAGESFTAVLGAWWPYPGSPQIAGCKAPITGVSLVSIALPAGSLDIALDQPWPQTCSSPATVSLEYTK